MMGIVTNKFRAVASACWRMHPRSTCLNNVDVLPSVMQHEKQQQQRHVWNASYENDKEANDIVQSIQQLKKKIMDPTACNNNVDAQHQVLRLKQDYRRVTGEEYDDDYSEKNHPNRMTATLDHPNNPDKPSNSMSNYHTSETARK